MNIIYFPCMPFSRIQDFSISSVLCLLFFSCSPQVPEEKTPAEKLDVFLGDFSNEWYALNDRFHIKLEDMNITLNDDNQSGTDLIASLNFPLNWTEFQYQEESDFAQGYDAIIQVKSNILITHKYVDGNWTFLSAEQTDFNTTLIEVADDYSKIIADAWIRRLPSRKEFTDQKDLFSKIPPNKRY